MVATHYCPDWDPRTDGGPELAWLNEYLQVFINQRVAHITAYRQRIPKKPYFVSTVQRHNQNLVQRFLAKVPPDVRQRIERPTIGQWPASGGFLYPSAPASFSDSSLVGKANTDIPIASEETMMGAYRQIAHQS